MMRLDKYLSDCGACSRKEAKMYIKAGRVTVDGKAAVSGDDKINEESAVVCLNGRELEYSRFHYYMLNKPEGYITATEDRSQKTVLDLFPPEIQRLGIFPVGRLDKDTTGLLLLTNDGDFAHQVITPSKHIPKLYEAELDIPATEEDEVSFQNGIVFHDGIKCMPAKLERVSEDGRLVRVIVYEGKYHQVKRMFNSCGKTVLKLRRLAIGGLALGNQILPGCYKKMSFFEKNRVFLLEKE